MGILRSTSRIASRWQEKPNSPRATSRRWASTCSQARAAPLAVRGPHGLRAHVIPAMLDGGRGCSLHVSRAIGKTWARSSRSGGHMALLEDDRSWTSTTRVADPTRSRERASAKVGATAQVPAASSRTLRERRTWSTACCRRASGGRGPSSRLDLMFDSVTDGRRGRPGHPRQGGRDRQARWLADVPTSTRRNKQVTERQNRASRGVTKQSVVPAGARLGRNVRSASASARRTSRPPRSARAARSSTSRGFRPAWRP